MDTKQPEDMKTKPRQGSAYKLLSLFELKWRQGEGTAFLKPLLHMDDVMNLVDEIVKIEKVKVEDTTRKETLREVEEIVQKEGQVIGVDVELKPGKYTNKATVNLKDMDLINRKLLLTTLLNQ